MDEHTSTEKHDEHHGYGVYLLTWIALILLTAVTVTVAGMQLGGLSVAVALLVAAVKGTVVVLFFMHLREEMPIFTIMLIVAIITLTIFIGVTFFDILFR